MVQILVIKLYSVYYYDDVIDHHVFELNQSIKKQTRAGEMTRCVGRHPIGDGEGGPQANQQRNQVFGAKLVASWYRSNTQGEVIMILRQHCLKIYIYLIDISSVHVLSG